MSVRPAHVNNADAGDRVTADGGMRGNPYPGQAPANSPIAGAAVPQYEGMQRALADLRSMLESQFSGMAWNDFGKRSPMQARMLRAFTSMGLDADVAGELVIRLPLEVTAGKSR